MDPYCKVLPLNLTNKWLLCCHVAICIMQEEDPAGFNGRNGVLEPLARANNHCFTVKYMSLFCFLCFSPSSIIFMRTMTNKSGENREGCMRGEPGKRVGYIG